MPRKYLAAVLIIALSFVLCMPVEAQSLIGPGSNGPIGGVTTGDVVGILVGAGVVVAVAVIVAIHYSKKRAITGCVSTGASGMTVTDEKDRQVYALSGDTTGVKPGDRMKLRGRKVKPKGPDKALVWEAKAVDKDFGVCQP